MPNPRISASTLGTNSIKPFAPGQVAGGSLQGLCTLSLNSLGPPAALHACWLLPHLTQKFRRQECQTLRNYIQIHIPMVHISTASPKVATGTVFPLPECLGPPTVALHYPAWALGVQGPGPHGSLISCKAGLRGFCAAHLQGSERAPSV